MSTLTITRNYADGSDLTEAELDSQNDSIETWANGNIGTANIGTSGVDTTQLAASSVTAAKIAADAVTTVKILDANVTADKIASLAVTTAKIAANAVTAAKMVVMNKTLTSSSGNYSTSSSSFTTVTNLSGSITTAGAPVKIELQSDGSGNTSQLNCGTGTLVYQILRDSTEIATGLFGLGGTAGGIPVSSVNHTDSSVTAGTYTYTFKVKALTGSPTLQVTYAKLLMREVAGGV